MTTESQIFALEGAHCAGCVLKVERALQVLPGVELARGNATQKRIRLIWNKDQQTPETLKQIIQNLGYDARPIESAGDPTAEVSLLPRLAAAAIGMMNIMAFSFSVWAGLVTDMQSSTMNVMHWLSAAVALPVVLYAGSVFYVPAFRAMRAGQVTMDTPISLAIWVTFAASIYATLQGAHDVYFDAVVSLIFFLLIGRVLEQSLRRKSGDAAGNLRTLMHVRARKVGVDGRTGDVPAQELTKGDHVLVFTGERIPADGISNSTRAELDESILTGETLPRTIQQGDVVAAGAIVVAGPLEVRVTHVGDDAQIGQMAQLVEDAAAHKGQMQHLADRFAQSYIPIVLGGGLFGFALWYLILGASFFDALMIAVAVLVVTCPCAAGLATPAVTSRAVNLLMKAGIIVKSGEALEALGGVDTIYLDKTGTAAQLQMVRSTELPAGVLQRAQALAASSGHPLAKALNGEGGGAPLDGAVEHAGQGIETPDGARLGSARFVGAPDAVQVYPTLWLAELHADPVAIEFDEAPRADLADFLKSTSALDVHLSLVSGDAAHSVERFANATGIKDWAAEQSASDKISRINAAQEAGHSILMVGDGVNDSAALSGAHVSASFRGATQIAQVAADIVLIQPVLSGLPKAIALSRHARRLVLQNLTFATVYNVVTVPLAFAGILTPLIAALLMSSSSVIVLANGLRLRRIE